MKKSRSTNLTPDPTTNRSSNDERVHTVAHLQAAERERLVEVARQQEKPLPEMAGRLIRLGLDVAQLRPVEQISPAPTHVAYPDMERLSKAVMLSRYPSDTGNARLQQVAILLVIAGELANRRPATATKLAEIIGAQRQVIGLLANKLVDRQILATKPVPLASRNTKQAGKSTQNQFQ